MYPQDEGLDNQNSSFSNLHTIVFNSSRVVLKLVRQKP